MFLEIRGASDSEPAVGGLFEALDGGEGEGGCEGVPFKSFHRDGGIKNTKHIEGVGFTALSRRCGGAGLDDQGRMAANLVTLGVTCVADVQMAGEK